jgi:hypothetical protein
MQSLRCALSALCLTAVALALGLEHSYGFTPRYNECIRNGRCEIQYFLHTLSQESRATPTCIVIKSSSLGSSS